jgi:hypothetical protein
LYSAASAADSWLLADATSQGCTAWMIALSIIERRLSSSWSSSFSLPARAAIAKAPAPTQCAKTLMGRPARS